MAGKDPAGNFNANVFRSAIRSTMVMGLANTVGDAPIFRWVNKEQYSIEDPAQRPYNWFQAPAAGTSAVVADVPGTPCAVEWLGDSEAGTTLGHIHEVHVRITILDSEWSALLAHGGTAPDQILLKGEIYEVEYVPAPQGLFDVDVWQIYAVARDTA